MKDNASIEPFNRVRGSEPWSLCLLTGPVLIDQEFIVEVTPIEERIWNRFEGSVDLGFNFLKANNNTQYSLTGNLSYRGRKWFSSVESHVSDRSDAARVTSNDVDFTANRMLQAGNWFIPMLAQYQTNSELQLDYRTLTGGGVGRVLDQTSRGLLMVGALATYTREAYYVQGTTNGAEGLIFLRVESCKLDSPKLNFLANLKVFPGLSDFGRIRVELDSQLRYEIFKDFYWGVTFYDSFDSRPPSTDSAIKNDYGVGTTVGWSL